MNTHYLLGAIMSSQDAPSLYDEFEANFKGSFTVGSPTVTDYLFKDRAILERAIVWLEQNNRPRWSVKYKLHLEPEEIKSHPAFWSIRTRPEYLFDKKGLLSEGAVYLGGLQVDEAREKAYVPKVGGQVIADRLRLSTQMILDVQGNEWKVLDFQTLPEREIPLSEASRVPGEGLPRRFIEKVHEGPLKEIGLCKTLFFRKDGQVVPHSPVFLMSGELVDACIQAGGAEAIKHFEPLFLESDPILKDPGFGHLILPRPLIPPIPQRSFEQMSQDMDQARQEAEPLLEIFRSTALYYPALLEALEKIRVKYGLNVLEIRKVRGDYELHSSIG